MKNPSRDILNLSFSGVQPYVLELTGESGDIHGKQFKTDLAGDYVSALIDDLILTLESKDYRPSKPLAYLSSDWGLVGPFGRAANLAAFEAMKPGNLLFSPEAPLRIAVQSRSRRRYDFVLVKVIAYQEGQALCKARYKGHWLEIELDRNSLERMDLREGDTFEWIPNDEGVVKDQDVRSHPRREDTGERERTEKAFDDLAAMVQKTVV